MGATIEQMRTALQTGCLCGWIHSNTEAHIHETHAECPVHNAGSVDRRVDYERIEEIVRRVVREEKR